MKDNILLASFINKEKIEDFYKKLEKFYSISKDKTFLFLMESWMSEIAAASEIICFKLFKSFI